MENTKNLVVAVLLLLVNFAQESESFTQELYLHETLDQSGNYLYFRSNVPDATIYNFENVKVVCAKGWWRAYDDFGYLLRSSIAYGDRTSSEVVCHNGTFNHKSFRHFASSNTTENSLSLYVGVNYEDREVFITETQTPMVLPPRLMYANDIKVNETMNWGVANGTLYDEEKPESVQALVITGDSGWTLYEGKNFTGKKTCRDGVTTGYFTYSQVKKLGLETVQSVKQGCDDHDYENDEDDDVDESMSSSESTVYENTASTVDKSTESTVHGSTENIVHKSTESTAYETTEEPKEDVE